MPRLRFPFPLACALAGALSLMAQALPLPGAGDAFGHAEQVAARAASLTFPANPDGFGPLDALVVALDAEAVGVPASAQVFFDVPMAVLRDERGGVAAVCFDEATGGFVPRSEGSCVVSWQRAPASRPDLTTVVGAVRPADA